MTESVSVVSAGSRPIANREQSEKEALALWGVAADVARKLAKVLQQDGCRSGLHEYLFPAPIVTDRGLVDAWMVMSPGGSTGLFYVAVTGQLYCNTGSDVVPWVQGGVSGFNQVPRYAVWYDYVHASLRSPAWLQLLQEAIDQMRTALALVDLG